MLTVQNYRLVPKRISFKANEAKENTQEKTIEKAPVAETKTETHAEKTPFKTHAGLKFGLIDSACTALLITTKTYKQSLAEYNNTYATAKGAKGNSKLLVLSGILGIIILPILGHYIDTRANKKHAQLAKDLETKNANEIMEKDSQVRFTEKERNPYYKSNNALKILPVYAAASSILATTTGIAAKFVKPTALILPVISTGVGALEGLFVDWCSNRAAKRHADKQATMDKVA